MCVCVVLCLTASFPLTSSMSNNLTNPKYHSSPTTKLLPPPATTSPSQSKNEPYQTFPESSSTRLLSPQRVVLVRKLSANTSPDTRFDHDLDDQFTQSLPAARYDLLLRERNPRSPYQRATPNPSPLVTSMHNPSYNSNDPFSPPLIDHSSTAMDEPNGEAATLPITNSTTNQSPLSSTTTNTTRQRHSSSTATQQSGYVQFDINIKGPNTAVDNSKDQTNMDPLSRLMDLGDDHPQESSPPPHSQSTSPLIEVPNHPLSQQYSSSPIRPPPTPKHLPLRSNQALIDVPTAEPMLYDPAEMSTLSASTELPPTTLEHQLDDIRLESSNRDYKVEDRDDHVDDDDDDDDDDASTNYDDDELKCFLRSNELSSQGARVVASGGANGSQSNGSGANGKGTSHKGSSTNRNKQYWAHQQLLQRRRRRQLEDAGGAGGGLFAELEDSVSGSNYDDFQTIDWQRDIAKDRMRHRYIVRNKDRGCFSLLRSTHDAWAGWLCVLAVGICAGLVAGIIDIGAGWMKDLKSGICPGAFYLNREQCCWSSDSELEESIWTEHCKLWKTWPELLGLDEANHIVASYIISYMVYVFWALLFAFLAASFVRTYAPYACGSGIPEIKTILSGFVIRGYLGSWTLTIKSLGMMLTVAAGLSLGKEGPLVHCSCCIGNIISRFFAKYGMNEAKKREILSAASAAGVSVAFGAPIGGVLFSLEEVSYYFPLKTLWRSFFCALVAAFVLRLINPFGNEHLVMFYIDYARPWIFFELIIFIMLGVIGGLIGNIFIKANLRWCQMRKFSRLGQFPMWEVLGVTAFTATFAYPNPYTRMNSSDLIKLLFSSCGIADESPLCDYYRNFTNVNEHVQIAQAGPGVYNSMGLLMMALIFKLFITIFTFGIKVPAGLFIPSLCMGAIVGRIVGVTMEQIAYNYPKWWFFQDACSNSGESCMSPGLYAVVGAAAVLGGVTRMTVSLVVIMFELTGNVNFIVPLMAAIMTAKWVGDALGKQGVYDAHIGLNDYPFLDNKEEFPHTTTASDAMRPKLGDSPLALLTEDSMTVSDIYALLKSTTHTGFPVIVSESSQFLVGFVTRNDLMMALNKAKKGEEVYDHSLVYFRSMTPDEQQTYQNRSKQFTGTDLGAQPQPLNFRRILDLAPITVTDQTPMETVIDMFRKLGLRQVLVTHNGHLLGLITKKDILLHMKECEEMRGRFEGVNTQDPASHHSGSFFA